MAEEPGFTAVAALTPGSGGRTLGGCRSTPKASRFPADMPRRDSSASHARTKLVGRRACAPDADSGARVLPETCGKSDGRPLECRAAVTGRVAKKSVCRAKSRMTIKLGVRRLRAARRILLVYRFSLIQQSAQSRTWARVAEDAFPGSVAIQLRQQGRQARHQFLAFLRRKSLDGFFDFFYRAHASKIPGGWHHGKFASPPTTTKPNEVDRSSPNSLSTLNH